ncbi:dihydrolipoamide acetyltransferase family protein [Pseudobacillus badius]|uniref:dihydrolipoamide acetyltransferase family protein n=1 Tax=Bacillus badius TaxID=1455 RepID=UPI0007B04FD6|nr:dihydrolipoamide acetyltransferase family protein [Bacillus badius]KZO00094.1 branched-chain alpha-keto acid dehydrogenase subunit E2 [Bacillus badius]OCS86256.1 branched-chain alpha-keto acid dehydrogenase subunit E2 [Bacillus badius]OVE52284.1 branched-chain alpha-keto acid dehydrogenase subunit E2 [Bacillus badius]TDW04004.1 pyruvate dehydrogenase E2 component (dihydrolipoamide acetyltransferase) [Bacillus badius]
MAVEVIMPKLGMAMKEGAVSNWNKQVGEAVEKGELLASINSEKIEMELEAPASGSLLDIAVQEGEGVPPGTVIGYIGQPGEKVPEAETSIAKQPADKEIAATAMEEEKPVSLSALTARSRLKISPVARKIAESAGIDYTQLKGSGPGGRITKEDVEKAVSAPSASEPEQREESTAPAAPQAAQQTSMTGMRKVIAERMHASLKNSAQLTITMKADATEAVQLREQMAETVQSHLAAKLSILDFVARAVVLALQKHPLMNSACMDGHIHQFESIHLGVAVALEKGLVVPVIRDAQNDSLVQLSKKIKLYAERARQGELNQDEMTGSTFTISNLGAYGVEYFTPILNSPEAGILGVGAVEEAAVFKEGTIECRRLLPLSLTFDHRVLDGAPAAAFLQTVKQLLEEPFTMLL